MISEGLKIINIQPDEHGTSEGQLYNCLKALQKRLLESNLSEDNLLKVSVFFHPEVSGTYLNQRKNIQEIFTVFFGNQYPAFSVISDFPDNGYHISLEAFVYTNKADYCLERKTFNGHRYAVLKSEHKKSLYVAGITMESYDENYLDMPAHAGYVFSTASQILKSEGFDFHNIIRSWNYIEDIVGTFQKDSMIFQNYQVFNDVRTSYYNQCTFENGYPSSTGIGTTKGGVVAEFIAVSVTEKASIIPIKNILQTDAYGYSQNVLISCPHKGTLEVSTPKFERAKLIIEDTDRMLFISGTASIINEKTISPESVMEQTKITLSLIASLLQSHLSECKNDIYAKDFYFRVYVKHKEDLPVVKAICESQWGNSNDCGQYLVADICRENLLVEIECTTISSSSDLSELKLSQANQKQQVQKIEL